MAPLQLARVVKENENPSLPKPCCFETQRWREREAPSEVFHCSVLISVKTRGLLEHNCNQAVAGW